MTYRTCLLKHIFYLLPILYITEKHTFVHFFDARSDCKSDQFTGNFKTCIVHLQLLVSLCLQRFVIHFHFTFILSRTVPDYGLFCKRAESIIFYIPRAIIKSVKIIAKFL